MGLLDKLISQGGSRYSDTNGATPQINPGATKLSVLHADGNKPGYSLDGSNASKVIADFNAYSDGVNNTIPQPTQLDLNSKTPSKYSDNLPK